MTVREFGASEGLIDVHFHKKWHRCDIDTASKKGDQSEEPVYLVIEGDHIRYATPAETDRVEEGHHVYNDLPSD